MNDRFLMQQGGIPVDELVDRDKIPHIKEAIERHGGEKLTPLKESLGEGFSYADIRFVWAEMQNTKVGEPSMETW